MLRKVALLMGLLILGTHICSFQFVDIDKNSQYVMITVEYAVFQFNEDQEDEFAYKFLRVRKSQQQMFSWIYLIDMELGRTVCKKHDEDIDNCPLQEGAGEKKVRCSFHVDAQPWITQFILLNSTCVPT
ncbi:cystatin-12-like [Cynocephalus volans]|uniref:cystatin-12-like n=1 Tax=Cynocephalus volans TaxID=110931 RepID=UPI002FC95E44